MQDVHSFMTGEPLVKQERSSCSAQVTTYWGPRKHLVEGALEMEPGFYFEIGRN